MASSINAANPIAGNPTTQSVRDNFAAAKSEIEALQAADALLAPLASPTFTGTLTAPAAVITSLTFNGVALTVTGTLLNGFDARITALESAGSVPDASTTVKGIVELATNTETTTGTDTARATTPAGVKAVADLKANIASPTFTGTATFPTVDINGGAIDGTVVGAASPANGTFTALTATTSATLGGTLVFSGNPALPYANDTASTTFDIDANAVAIQRLAVSDDCSITLSNMVDGHQITLFVRPTTNTSHTVSFGLSKTGTTGGNSFSGVLPANSGDYTEFKIIKLGGTIYVTSPSFYA